MAADSSPAKGQVATCPDGTQCPHGCRAPACFRYPVGQSTPPASVPTEASALAADLEDRIATARHYDFKMIEIPVSDARKILSALRQPHEPAAERLTLCLQAVMADLADLLDADQFNNIEARVLAAGVPYPPLGTDPRTTLTKGGNHETA